MTLDILERGGWPLYGAPSIGKAQFNKDMIGAFFF
jgi:hypothetical protein